MTALAALRSVGLKRLTAMRLITPMTVMPSRFDPPVCLCLSMQVSILSHSCKTLMPCPRMGHGALCMSQSPDWRAQFVNPDPRSHIP